MSDTGTSVDAFGTAATSAANFNQYNPWGGLAAGATAAGAGATAAFGAAGANAKTAAEQQQQLIMSRYLANQHSFNQVYSASLYNLPGWPAASASQLEQYSQLALQSIAQQHTSQAQASHSGGGGLAVPGAGHQLAYGHLGAAAPAQGERVGRDEEEDEGNCTPPSSLNSTAGANERTAADSAPSANTSANSLCAGAKVSPTQAGFLHGLLQHNQNDSGNASGVNPDSSGISSQSDCSPQLQSNMAPGASLFMPSNLSGMGHNLAPSQVATGNLATGQRSVHSVADTPPLSAIQVTASGKKKGQPVPGHMKDNTYWERRRRNNDSARRSREQRRRKEESVQMKVVYLEHENVNLRSEVAMLRAELDRYKLMFWQQQQMQSQQTQ